MFMRLIFFTLFALPAQAGVIDFEGLGDQFGFNSTTIDETLVTIRCGTTTNSGSCFTFHYGGVETAFFPGDIPATGFGNGTDVGFVGLTDEFDGPTPTALDFFFQFSRPITQLGFDVIDAEGPGESFTITLFANADFTGFLGTTSLIISPGLPDGSVQSINAILSGTSALSARFGDSGADGGVAIDNIRFTTAIPSPPIAGIFGLGLLGLTRLRRRSIFFTCNRFSQSI